jgi:D-alanyl-D-alanine carboxypeptidase/D-alanyl-D-alanine-endopeptidase (penicillin-binding protein 4)
MEDVGEELGVDREAILLRDGSGMSHKNLISTDNLARLLFHVQRQPWFDVFRNSLPIAGEPDRFLGGTLRNRLTEAPAKGNVLAKTGLITGVTALSGYVTAKNGEELIFAILINNHLGSSETMQDIENQLVITLAEHDF